MAKKDQPSKPPQPETPPPAGSTPPAPPVANAHTTRTWLVSLGLLAALTLAMFGNVLFTSNPVVLSNVVGDTFHQFFQWRAFGFGEMKQGHFPLWDPYVFSGAPFFGGFQSSLLYPPNVLFLFLPLGAAINWSIALHVFLIGAFTYAWAARRRLLPTACFIAGVIAMFCGAFSLHIYSGHLPHLCAMACAPLVFLCLDSLIEKPGLGWTLAGMAAVAMQILSGHPQYVYETALAAAIYCALCLPQARQLPRSLAALAGMATGGVALSAVQVCTSLQEAPEMIRSRGLAYSVAAGFSFPPENFLTLLAPDFFGNLKSVAYWGRCALWEMCLFIGVIGLVLAVTGVVLGERRHRRRCLVMVVVMLLLALGAHTPLFGVLYHALPGFSSFRGTTKFIFLASLFLALLAALGTDALLKGARVPKWFVAGTGLLATALLAAGFVIHQAGAGTIMANWWQSLMLAVRSTGEIFYLEGSTYEDPAFVRAAAGVAARGILTAGGLLLLGTALLGWIRRDRRATWLLVGLGVLELFIFAHRHLDTFDSHVAMNPEIQAVLDRHPGDYRIINQISPNAALTLRTPDLWGSDPGVLLRYAEFIAFTEGVDPDQVTQFLTFNRRSPLLAMLRYHLAFVPGPDGVDVFERPAYLPHVFIAQHCQVIPKRDDIFAALANNFTNLQSLVFLESAPDPQPDPNSEPGSARIVDSTADHLTIEAELKVPGILVITDPYAKGWRAHDLSDGGGRQYPILPANYCLRAIPLAAGTHRLSLDYLPSGFVVGRWISAIALVIFLATSALQGWRWFCPGRKV